MCVCVWCPALLAGCGQDSTAQILPRCGNLHRSRTAITTVEWAQLSSESKPAGPSRPDLSWAWHILLKTRWTTGDGMESENCHNKMQSFSCSHPMSLWNSRARNCTEMESNMFGTLDAMAVCFLTRIFITFHPQIPHHSYVQRLLHCLAIYGFYLATFYFRCWHLSPFVCLLAYCRHSVTLCPAGALL